MSEVRVGQVWEWRFNPETAPLRYVVLDVGLSHAWCSVEMGNGEHYRHAYPLWEFTERGSRYRLVAEGEAGEKERDSEPR